MGAHNALLTATRDEVKTMKSRQAAAQAEMDKLEAELMAKWTEEKAAGKIPMDKVEALLNGWFTPSHFADREVQQLQSCRKLHSHHYPAVGLT